VAVKGDHFILRRPSPGETIGGGVVTNPHPGRRHRRNNPQVLARLEIQKRGSPAERLLEALDRLGPVPLSEALREAGQASDGLEDRLAELTRSGDLVEIDGPSLVTSRSGWALFENQMLGILAAFHAAHPLRTGMPREELKSRLGQRLEAERRASWSARVFNALMAKAAAEGVVVVAGSTVRHAGHEVRLTPQEQAQVSALIADFERDPYNTLSHKDCVERVGNELLAALLEQGRLVQVSAEVIFLAETYNGMIEQIRGALQAKGKITVGEVRDMFKTSRKYALALMEYLDHEGVTQRVGDERVLRA
jgi:selenocysteine-specific elongation factor